MAEYITNIYDKNGNIVYPKTSLDAVIIDEENNTLADNLVNYQAKEDNTLNTLNKTIVGAINELFSMILEISGTTNPVDLTYSFSNQTSGYAYGSIALSSNDSANDGTYTICWADANGKLDDYKDIASFTLSGNMIKTYEFISTNIIPKEATRIIAIKDEEIKASYNIEASKLNTDTKLYSIGLLSDIHIDTTNDKSDSVADFQRAISRFEKEGVTAICSTGDTVVDGTQEEVEKFIEVKNSTSIPMYIARGNHDCLSYCNTNWTTLVEPNGLYFEKEIGGDIYLFMGMYAESFNLNLFSTEQLNWLEERLENYKNRRVFLFEHVFVEPVGNVNSLYPYSSMGNVEGQPGKIFRNLMAKYRNVILFTGHSHLEFILQRLADNANCSERTDTLCHRVHIPSCAKPRSNDVTTEDISSNTYNNYGSSEGYVMDVYQDYIILKGINFVDNKYLPLAQYRINTTPIAYSEATLLCYLDGSSSENTTSTIKDLSGNGNDFVANNIILDTANGAITFDGSSSYLINETLQPVTTANDIFSFEFVAESNEVRTDSQTIISMGKSSPGRISYRYKCVEGDDDIYADYGSTTSLDLTSTNNSTIETDFNNKKHHVVIVRKANQLLTYLDGVLNKTVNKDSDTTIIESRTVIGAKYNYSDNYFIGKIYMCKLYTGELTADEVLNKYNDSISNLNLLFHLDGSSSENTTSLIKDLSGNGNDFVTNNITLDTTNGAINFDGSSSYLINENLQPVTTANDIFSFEFVAESNIIRSSSQIIISLGSSAPNRITYRYGRYATDRQNIFADYGATNDIDILSTSSTDLSIKYHVVIVRRNNEILTYINGVLNKTEAKAEDTTTIGARTTIGSKYSYDSDFFSGKIYMCKLYNRELSADEILNKYNKVINIEYVTYRIVNAFETLSNTKEKPIKNAILKGSTKYRDIDTQEVLDAFEDGRNLELVSAKKLVLKTSNISSTKTNILTVSEDVTLRKIGSVQDEFNVLTGEVTEHIGEIVLNGSEDWVVDSDTNSTRSAFALAHNGTMKKYEAILCDKYEPKTAKQGVAVYGYVYIGSSSINLYEEPNMSLDTFKAKLASNPITIQYPLVTESTKTVDLSIINQNGNNINSLNTFSDITHIEIESESILPEVEIEVAINKN